MWYLQLSVALYLSSSGLLYCEKMRNKSIHSPAECNKHSLIVDLWSTHSCHSVQWDAGSTQKPSLWVSLWEEAVCWKRMWPTPWTSLNCPPLSDHLQQQHSTLQHSTLHYNTQSTTPFPAGFKQACFLAESNAIAGLSKWWDIKAMFGTPYYNSTIFTVCSMCNVLTMHILWIPT